MSYCTVLQIQLPNKRLSQRSSMTHLFEASCRSRECLAPTPLSGSGSSQLGLPGAFVPVSLHRLLLGSLRRLVQGSRRAHSSQLQGSAKCNCTLLRCAATAHRAAALCNTAQRCNTTQPPYIYQSALQCRHIYAGL